MLVALTAAGRPSRPAGRVSRRPEARAGLNHVLRSLPAAEFEMLRPHLERRQLEQEQVLYEPGERIAAVYFPQTAAVSLMGVTSETAVEVALVGSEGVIGTPCALHA